MTKTKYEGIYYRLDKYKNKVYVARLFINGKDTTKTLGKEPQINLKTAVRLRLDYIDKYKHGIIKDNKKTINLLFEEYLEYRKATISHSWHYNSHINYNKYLKNEIGHKLPQTVTASDIQKIVNAMLESGKAPQTAKQIKEIVTAFYKYLPNLGVKEIDNIGKLVKIPKFDNTRHVELTDEQIHRLFDAIYKYKDIKIRTIFIWLTHGRRKGEVLNMKWEDINFENNTYTLEGELTKNRQTQIYDLSETLLACLKEYGIKEKGLIFPSNTKPNQIIGKTGMDYHWKNIRIATGFANINMHDLRHVVGNFAVNKGYGLEVIASALGHKSSNITKRYSHVKRESASSVIDDLVNTFKPS